MLISILTPAFNEEVHLDQMVRSVIDQSYRAWELLLLDDGSQDATAELIEKWAVADDRIKVVSLREKHGKVGAFNLLAEHAKGDLICHVGADDLLPATSLEDRAKAFAKVTGMGVALGKFQMIDADGLVISGPMPRGEAGSQSSPGATYNRALADVIFPIPAELPSEDIWLGNAAVGCANEVIHLTEVIINYRVHGGNSNPRSKNFEKMDDAIKIRMEALKLLAESDLPLDERVREGLAERYQLELRRRSRDLVGVLTRSNSRIVDRIAIAAMTHPALWKVRQKLGARATGWRGR